MTISARPWGLTPWRMARTQSTGWYAATTPPGPVVMLGPAMRRLPSSTKVRPAPLAPWQSTQPRDAYRYLPRASACVAGEHRAPVAPCTSTLRCIFCWASCRPAKTAAPLTSTTTTASTHAAALSH
jgi:hypothetical protein